jgi:hypothetical protein
MEQKVGEVADPRIDPTQLKIQAKGKTSKGNPIARLKGCPHPGKVEGPKMGIVINKGKVVPGQEPVMEGGPIGPQN